MPIIYAIISYFLYATQAFVLEQKLSRYNSAALLIVLYLMMLPLALLGLLGVKSGEAVAWPSGKGLWIVAGAALVFFLADFFMVSAYRAAFTQGQEYLFGIVAVAALFPVFASFLKYVATRQLPNGYHVAAYVLVAGVLLLTAKGNSLDQKRAEAAKLTEISQKTP